MKRGASDRAEGLPPVLTRQEGEVLSARIFREVSAAAAEVRIVSGTKATTAFALGDMHVVTEEMRLEVSLTVELADGRRAMAVTNRLDDAGLRGLVADAEAAARQERVRRPAGLFVGPQRPPPAPQLFFESMLPSAAPEARAILFRQATDAAEAAGLVAAGDIQLEFSSRAAFNTRGLAVYDRHSYGEFSLTARTKSGDGSGWAWTGAEDWARVDPASVIARAADLGQRSAGPVAVEPGRYTVILEPAAVAQLIHPILTQTWARHVDAGGYVFSKQPVGTNKIGLQVMDRRVSMVFDPWDPMMPGDTWDFYANWPVKREVFIERGVLRNLHYDLRYARRKGREPVLFGSGLRVDVAGQAQTLEEMIASTTRGIWVNRLSGVSVMNAGTLLLSGTTRDGTFLIENGRITKSIKNLRFTESPLFVLNKLDAWGEPVRAARDIVAPRLKVRDFNFTSLTDAI